MTLTTDIEGHGYILFPMATYVCVRVTINSLWPKRLFDIFISVLLNSMTLASDLESHGHILVPMADYVSVHVRVKIKSL